VQDRKEMRLEEKDEETDAEARCPAIITLTVEDQDLYARLPLPISPSTNKKFKVNPV
jgi:hypothetical protein